MTASLLEARGLCFGYRGRPVVRGVSLALRAGEFLAVVGPNGCGKSTLLRLMAGLERPEAGAVSLQGCALRSWPRRALARHLAMLPQAASLPEALIARDLVAMGRHPWQGFLDRRSAADTAAIAEALARMEVADLADRPLGALSGGQRQRVRMAMVLAQGGEVLLLDEPTSFLDLRHQHGILAQARLLARQGRAVVAVLHDFSQAALYADRIALMHEGRLLGVGPAADVLTEAAVETAFGLRTRRHELGGALIHLPADLVPGPVPGAGGA